MVTITICNQKGGAAKTTTAAALAAGIARRGYKVLTVDIDPQHNLTSTAATAALSSTLADVLQGSPAADAIKNTAHGFDILPGSLDLSTPPDGYALDTLKAALASVAGVYDYCIIDTPPALSILTISALVAAQYVVIPVKAEVYSLYGLDQLQETIAAVKPYNPGLQIAGILITQYNPRRNLDSTMKDTIEKKAQEMGADVFKQTIRAGVSAAEAQLLRQDIFTAAPRAAITADYGAFVDELLKGVQNG